MTNATPTPAAQAPAASTPWNTGLVPLSRAAFDVLAERQRQIETEGWTPEHDDRHGPATLAVAAGYYALCTDAFPNAGQPPLGWPWDASWWKPKDFRRDLQRAGALILAAMECHDRQHGEAPVERPVPHMIDAVRAVLARHLDPVGISKAEAIAEIIAIVGDPRYAPPARPAPQSSEATLRLRACAKTQVAATRACLSLVDALIAKHGDRPVSGADAVRLAEALQRLEDSTAALVAAAHAGPASRAGHG